MDSITRSVRDIELADRRALEKVIGTQLAENQKVVIQVLNLDIPSAEQKDFDRQAQSRMLPEWCNVYEGLSDAEIADLESSIVRSSDSRSFH
jgi:hypothetical protein